MHILSTLLPALGLFAQLSVAAYTLRDDYGTTNSFFDKFNFFTVWETYDSTISLNYILLYVLTR